MTEFRDIIGKKLKAVSFTTSFEGHEDYSKDDKADFDYLPLGGLTMLFDDEHVYRIADYEPTSLGTEGIGIRKMAEVKQWPNTDVLSDKWKDKIGESIKAVKLYYNVEQWNNGLKNERYIESIELQFESRTVFYFCGDVDTYNEAEKIYNLLAGRSCGLIFYNADSFKKHKLDKVEGVEEITTYNTAISHAGTVDI
jgi:hypothetical protein